MGLRVGSSKINGVKVVGEDISRSVIITEETLPNGGIVKHFRGVAEGEWVRPSDWPDLSKLDRTGQVIYITYPADEEHGYLGIKCNPSVKIAIGHIENNQYVVESESSTTGNTWAWRYFGEANNTGYKVIRITSSNNIIKFNIGQDSDSAGSSVDGHTVSNTAQYALEIYGNLPNCTSFFARRLGHLECVDVKNIKPESLSTAFKNSRKLKTVRSINTWDTSACTTISEIFNGCVSLEKVDVANLCSSVCTSVSYAFGSCTNLKEIDLSTWNTSSVTSFTYLFYYCRMLRKIIFPFQFVKSAATNLGYMFAGLNSLQSLDMSDWNTSNVTNVQWMFTYQTSLDTIDFTGLDFSKITSTASNNGMYGMTSAGTAYKIIFPASTTVIGQFCLYTSQDIISTLWEYHFLSTSPPTMGGTYLARAAGNNNIKVYVPYSSDHSILEAYKTATNWSTYASVMVEEPQGE